MSRQDNSDPLPYVQVDRSVKPRAALLAGALGVTTQHALGSLVEWWDLCGDPRELEAIAAATPDGSEPERLLPRGDVELRFRLASGRDVAVETLEALGLVERKGEVFRVRGMSRYFAPVQARVKARAAASAGGRASAEARRRQTGTAQPRSGSRSGARSEAASSAASGALREHFEAPPNGSRTVPNPIGQRSTVNGQLSPLEDAPTSGAPEKPRRGKTQKPTDPRHTPLVAELVAAFTELRGVSYPFTGRDAKAVTNLLATGHEPAAIVAAWRRALRHSGFPTVATLSELVTHLAHFLGEAPQGNGPAESADWSDAQTGEMPL